MKKKNNSCVLTILELIAVFVAAQLTRFLIKLSLFLICERADMSDRLFSGVAMCLLSAAVLFYAKKRRVPVNVFPQKFSVFYITATAVGAVLIISSPFITGELGAFKLYMVFYSSLIIPVFEELLFRGYAWSRLEKAFEKQWLVFLITAILFGLWHLGYVDALALRVQPTALANVMLWKAVTGVCYGVMLGLIRWKCRNCYITMLVHGALNVFAF